MITLTEDQARNVFALLDVAVKAGGLPNAAIAVPLAQDIERQLQEAEAAKEKDPPEPKSA